MIEPLEIIFLVALAFASSVWTAIIGLGGGIMIISFLPGILPNSAIIPVHGVVQWFSNGGRLAFGLKDAVWRLIWPFLFGGVLEAAIGSQLVVRFPMDFLPLILGIFILLMIWLSSMFLHVKLPGGFFSLGFVESFLTLFLGVAGPLSAPFLIRERLSKDEIVVTSAAISLIAHSLKLIAFLFIGFAFGEYLWLLLGMVIAVTAGAYVGTRLRGWVSEELFIKIFKVVVSILAARMIISAALDLISN